ncbi:MAG: ankyrin repeat domain-containing protein [Candidatus Delongbacteria bacterium]
MKISLLTLLSFFLIGSFLSSCSSDEDKLFRAIKSGDLEQVRSLVQSGVSVLTNNKSGLSPLDVAKLNDRKEIIEFIYQEIKIVLDKKTQKLLDSVFKSSLETLKQLEEERKKYYDLYLESSDKLMNFISDDKRLAENIAEEQVEYFNIHQKHLKAFVNSKVDLIEAILKELVRRGHLGNIGSKEARHIVNVSIMYKLDEI